MREWNLKSGDPLSLIIAADARMGTTDYFDDQIWELNLRGGDPPAITVETTYGLRARIMRMFPRFSEGEISLTDPRLFHKAPTIRKIFPNYLLISYAPFEELDISAEYWVPDSHSITGRLLLTNQGNRQRNIKFEWIGQLSPNSGQRMAPNEANGTTIISGSTDNLETVILMTGGAKAGTGAYPCLALDINLNPEGNQQIRWAHTGNPDQNQSLASARRIITCNWEAEQARIVMQNATLIEIHTGDKDWDAALLFAQKSAINLLFGPTSHLPYPSYVQTRLPDQGYSLRGDGSDYNHFWNGQTPLEAYYLASIILPVAPQIIEGILYNYLSTQEPNGFIDWKPGLAGQRSRLLATPLLATLAWRIYETNQRLAYLEGIFPALQKFIGNWFEANHDRDGDGCPEWDHLLQSGSEEHPAYSHWHEWSQCLDITLAETPALCSFLYQECASLIKMANLLNEPEQISQLEQWMNQLRRAIESSWNPMEFCYADWDRETHKSPPKELFFQAKGSGSYQINRTFEYPVRLLIHLHTTTPSKRQVVCFIHGISASGQHRVERIEGDKFNWYFNKAFLTGENTYSAVDSIEIQGLEPADESILYVAGYNQMTSSLLAPIWAGIPDAEVARQLVEETIYNPHKFWGNYGLPACTYLDKETDSTVCGTVNMPWNTIIGEGLVMYGYRSEAAELVMRLMKAIIQTMKSDGSFRRYYNSESGMGIGERNALIGMAPLGLFLEVLGIRIYSPHRIGFNGFNPYPWPVTVKYSGVTILCQKDKTIVIFPDGQTVEINDPTPRIISLEIQ